MRDDDGPDLSAPLFQEPPDGLDEAWTWGFLTGGIASADAEQPADEFLLAANALVEAALAEKDSAYRYRNAVLYLYRHALELYLKQIVRPSRGNHKLLPLIEEFEKVVRRDFNQSVPGDVMDRLREWAEQDPRSTTWRYGNEAPTDGDERWLDLHHLHAVMNYLADNFKRIRKPLHRR